jgi:hypothetical protein
MRISKRVCNWDGGSALLCNDYKAPEGYPIVRISSAVRVEPVDQQKVELGWRLQIKATP